jgi:hypothetical protein
MSPLQRFLSAVLPRAWAEEMRADTERWAVRCACGFERSLWDLGGIRWKGSGRSWMWAACPRCGRRGWHTIYRKDA